MNQNPEEQLANVCNAVAESVMEMTDEQVEEEFGADDAEKIRAVLTEGVNVSFLNARYKHEIEQVKELGERIGYGNMMSIASVLWAMSLEEKHGITSGAFVATIPAFMKKREAEKAAKERESRKEFFKRLGVK
jgi:hypothetical protein